MAASQRKDDRNGEETVSVREFRNNLSSLFTRVAHANHRLIVTRYKDSVAVVPTEWLEEYERLKKMTRADRVKMGVDQLANGDVVELAAPEFEGGGSESPSAQADDEDTDTNER